MLFIVILSDALSIMIPARSSESTVKHFLLDSGAFDYIDDQVHNHVFCNRSMRL